jgi:hypothetical protein
MWAIIQSDGVPIGIYSYSAADGEILGVVNFCYLKSYDVFSKQCGVTEM